MSKKSIKEAENKKVEESKVIQTFNFPEHKMIVKAESIEEANSILQKIISKK